LQLPSDLREPELPETNPDIAFNDLLPAIVTSESQDVELDATNSAKGESDDSAWREELAARLDRFRSRRKIRPPRYPSPRLPFDALERTRYTNPTPSRANFEPLSDHALALNQAREPRQTQEALRDEIILDPASAAPPIVAPEKISPGNAGSAKIIEFPRFAWAPPPPPPDQLAEPVLDRPRILEVPETAPPPPALGGITIEPAEAPALEKLPGIDFPLQSASLSRRIFACIVDGLVIAIASSLFGAIFWKVSRVRPTMPQLIALAATIPVLLWAIYHYILIVYGASTPGLRASGLELTRFDGIPTTRCLRRWRVLASYLSAVSLGMGYAWLFLDEDALCWHDRITRTYLAPANPSCKSN
jgi:hypothetical protein